MTLQEIIIIESNSDDRHVLMKILHQQHLIIKTLEMTKQEFVQAINDLTTEVGNIPQPSTDVDQSIVDAFTALKAAIDKLVPATPPADTTAPTT